LEDDEPAMPLLAGIGVLQDTYTCYVYAETVPLLSHSLGRTLAGLHKTHIVLTSIVGILNPSAQELLQMHLNPSLHLRELDGTFQEAD
jgi:hypothetical protein